MRSFVIVFFVLFLASACTSLDCSINNTVACQWQLRRGDGLDTLKTDTLTIYTVRADNQDTILYNRGTGAVTSFSIPMSYVRDADVLLLHLADTAYHEWTDTITLQKKSQLHMESVDCSPQYYHQLLGVQHTSHIIDSIVINQPNVTNDATLKNILLYLRSH